MNRENNSSKFEKLDFLTPFDFKLYGACKFYLKEKITSNAGQGCLKWIHTNEYR